MSGTSRGGGGIFRRHLNPEREYAGHHHVKIRLKNLQFDSDRNVNAILSFTLSKIRIAFCNLDFQRRILRL